MDLAETWRISFDELLRRPEKAEPLKEASLEGRLGDWTAHLTGLVVESCQSLGWETAAKKHKLESLPISGQEYLSLDAIAFAAGDKGWRFPLAVFELENSRSDKRIAYSLWKVLNVLSPLRVVFCYRPDPMGGSDLMGFLRREVVEAIPLEERSRYSGRTLVIVGSRGDSATFPYGFFKWWKLDLNTATFRLK